MKIKCLNCGLEQEVADRLTQRCRNCQGLLINQTIIYSAKAAEQFGTAKFKMEDGSIKEGTGAFDDPTYIEMYNWDDKMILGIGVYSAPGRQGRYKRNLK